MFDAINAFLEQTQVTVNGVVKIKFNKGNAIVVGRKSDQSLYQYDLATYKSDDQFDHNASEGFIKIWGLPSEVNSIINKKSG